MPAQIADLSRNLRFSCPSGVDMMQIMKGVVCLTLGSTMRPRLPTSLCFRTFCSRYLRFLSVFAPCMTTYMFIRSPHQVRGNTHSVDPVANARHGQRCASIRRKQKKEIGVAPVAEDAKKFRCGEGMRRAGGGRSWRTWRLPRPATARGCGAPRYGERHTSPH